MARLDIATESEVQDKLPSSRTRPDRREGRHVLPFHELSPDEFEDFCFLLLRREHPGDDIRSYAGTGDGGRDLVHRMTTPDGVRVRLVQCKRYTSTVGVAVVRKDMAKVWANVFDGTIPVRPNEVVFYVTPRLSPDAQKLLDSQDRWRQVAGDVLAEHLSSPVPEDLARFAAEWWPTPTCEAALSLSDRARNYTDLVEQFFAVKKVIDGSVADVTNAVCDRVLPPIAELADRVRRVVQAGDAVQVGTASSPGDLKATFARASAGLLRWPTTVAGGHWLDRPELTTLQASLASPEGSVTVVLGPPGSGKSALLARLGKHLVDSGVTVLAVKADQLRNTVDTAAKLAERLGLQAVTHEAVLAVAAAEPVVVLLDQLDALADLADLKSERLHVLLDLVDRLAGYPRVHLVCSCREFEYRHDGRLGRLDANAMRLRPPTWEQVSAVLDAHGVTAAGWPEDARALLQTPHHLAVFLNRLRGPGEHQVFTTYQQLFNDLWQEQVVRPGGGRADLLHDLADHLADREELWADRGRFDGRWGTAEALVAAGLLTPDDDGFRLGFRHQSLFEFTRARSFARGNASLAEHVVARQHGLFVRPTLWMTLNYLRLADPAAYAHEFDALWTRPDLRRHVKHLLIDFLAQVEQPAPADWEQARLVGALRDPSWRLKVLSAITGRTAWFRLFAGSVLPAEMRRPYDEAWAVVWVLVSALGSDRGRCLGLMRENWLPDGTKLPLVWQTLTYLAEWDEPAADLAVAVVRGSPVAQGHMWHLAQAMAKGAPLLAVRLVAAWLDAARHRATGDEASAGLRKLLDSHNSWHDVEKLAGHVPVEFARALWPAVCDIITRQGGYVSTVVVRYADDMVAFARLDRREYVRLDSPDHFYLAFDSALRAFARTRPAEFLTTVGSALNADSRLLQRLVCRGVRELAPEHPDAALAFLTADPRRFWLGGTHDEQGDSIELIATLAPHLTDEGLARLTAAIRAWEVYRDDVGRDESNEYARGHRFRLLSALPPDRLPDDVRREVEAERAALPAHVQIAHPRFTGGFQLITSPVSKDELAARTDAEIAALFDELPDSTDDHHPKDWMRGGSVQLSREFEEFVKEYPDRAAAVVARLRPGVQERPAAHAVQGLVAAKRLAGEVIEFVQRLDARGFSGEDFRSSVAYSLGDLGREGGLSDAACELLNRWRVVEWANNDRAEPEGDEGDPARPTSILWRYGGTVGLPHGRFPVLAALTRGYLYRTPPAADRWLAILLDHVDRDESLTNWRAMALYLDNLWCCPDRVRASEFLVRLLARHPAVFADDRGVYFLARVAALFPDDRRRCAYEVVRGWGGRHGQQAFGELVGLRYLLHADDDWAREQVEASLAEPAGGEWVAVGVAFAAANLWCEPECRARATEVLCRLVRHPAGAVGHAVMSVYLTRDDLPLDDATLGLFRAVAAQPEILRQPSLDEAFFDHLLDALLIDADLVCRLAEEAVARRGAELQSLAHGFYMAGSVLIDISLRLQRIGGDLRRRGMDLFEGLLDLGVSEAVGVARSNDLRLVVGTPVRMPRRRRRQSAQPEDS